MEGQNELAKLWQIFLNERNDPNLDACMQKFLETYNSNSLHSGRILELCDLPDGFLSEISNRLLRYSKLGLTRLITSQRQRVLLLIRCLSTLARNPQTIALIASLSVINSVYKLLSLPSDLQETSPFSREIISEFMTLLERLLDPYRIWQSTLLSSSSSAVGVHHEHPSASVDGTVITFICECSESKYLDYELKARLIDIIGCILSGSHRNATLITCEAILDKLYHLLIENCMEVLTIPTGLRRNIFTCFTVMVHTLHSSSPEMRHMDVCDVIDRFLKAMETLHTQEQRNPDHFISILDTVRNMVGRQKDLEALKASFATINVFKRLLNFVAGFKVTESTAAGVGRLHKALILCLESFLCNSPVARRSFTATIGYDGLLRLLERLQPDRALLTLIIQMAINKDVDPGEENHKEANIENVGILNMLIAWLPDIEHAADQFWLTKMICDIACNSERNRMSCCNNGVVLTAIKAMQKTVSSAPSSKTSCILIRIVEQLGALSITPSEMKALVYLFQLKDVGLNLGPFQKRILQAFRQMTREQTPGKPFCYFSFPSPTPIIQIAKNKRLKGLKSGFTFHAWLCLGKSQLTGRRVIYSFQPESGSGFEAFVSADGFLYVTFPAENQCSFIHAVPLTLTDGQWHMLDTVHSTKRELMVMVYIDGKLQSCSTCAKFLPKGRLSYSIGGTTGDQTTVSVPAGRQRAASSSKPMRKRLSSMLLNFPSDPQNKQPLTQVNVSQLRERFGNPVGLDGQMSSICLFKKPLEDQQINQIFKEGANHAEMFCDSDTGSALILSLHPKVCRRRGYSDMNKSNMAPVIGEEQTCVNWSIMETLHCMGGFDVLISLLENLHWKPSPSADHDFCTTADEGNCLSKFFEFLRSYIENAEESIAQLLSGNSIPIIGALLQKLGPHLIDHATLKAVQNVMNGLGQQNPDLYNCLLHHVIFDFSIWNASKQWEVRVGHAQYVSQVIREQYTHSKQDFRAKFGVQFMLDVIREFCCQVGDANASKPIRTALFDTIKFYMHQHLERDDVQAILLFIHSAPCHVMLEAIALVRELLDLEENDSPHLALCEGDNSCLLYPILAGMSTAEEKAQLAVAEILRLLLTSDGSRQQGIKSWIIEGLVGKLQSPSDQLIQAVFGVIESAGPALTCLSMVSLARRTSPGTKLYISTKLLEKLQSTPSFSAKLLHERGWQECLSHLVREEREHLHTLEPTVGELDSAAQCRLLQYLETNLYDIHCELIWKDTSGTVRQNWKERMKIFHSLRRTQGLHQMYIEPIVYSRWLLEAMLNKCSEALKNNGNATGNATCNGDAAVTQKAQQLIKLVFGFIQFYESIRERCFSEKLYEGATSLLNQMSVWKNCASFRDIGKIRLFILLKFACRSKNQLSALAAETLKQLVRSKQIREDAELNYCVFTLHEAFQTPGLSENHLHIMDVIGVLLEQHQNSLELGNVLLLQSAACTGTVQVDPKFLNSPVWTNYVFSTVKERQSLCVRKLEELEEEVQDLWNEVQTDYNNDSQKYMRQVELSVRRFNVDILAALNEKKEAEMRRYKNNKRRSSNYSQEMLEEWSCRKRSLSKLCKSSCLQSTADREAEMSVGEKSIAERSILSNDEMADWQMSSLENYKRMRTKLVPNSLYSSWTGRSCVSHLHDDPISQNATVEELRLDGSISPGGAHEEKVKQSTLTNNPNSTAGIVRSISVKEELPYQMICELVSMRDSWPGRLELSAKSLSFLVNDTDKQRGKNFTWPLRMLLNIHCRVMDQQETAAEIFLRDGANCLINFQSKTLREKFLREIERLKGTDSTFRIFTASATVFSDSQCMAQWQRREISNFDYLMQLNTIAGRTYNDWSQYPIFPRVFKDYNSPGEKTLNLEDPTIYRDFTKRTENYPWYDGDCWSEFSMEQAFRSTHTDSCQELAPDFFCVPDFFVSNDRVNLGRPKGRVDFPAWTAEFPDSGAHEEFLRASDFVWNHRMALESDFVSSKLHIWIDLIFGSNQQDQSLERCSDKGSGSDHSFNRSSQLPAQLLTSEHPRRWTKEACLARLIEEGKAISILDYLKTLKTANVHSITVYEKAKSGNLMLVCIASLFFTIVGFDNLITISDEGFVGLHKWQGVKSGDVFKFRFVSGYPPDSRRCQLIEPLSDGHKLKDTLVAVSTDTEKAFVGGYWDGTLRVHQLNPAVGHTRVRRIRAHREVITCLHLDANGDLLMTGSADTTCKIWQTADLNDRCKPLQCLYGHDDEVTCVSISTEYDMAVSGSKDGTINIHTIGKGLLLQSLSILRKWKDSQLTVKQMALTNLGDILFYTEETNLSFSEKVVTFLWRYSQNGQFLDQHPVGTVKDPCQITTQLLPLRDYLLYGTSQGLLYVREIHRLKRVDRRQLNKPIRCVSAAYVASQRQYSHILVGLEGTPSLIVVFGPPILE